MPDPDASGDVEFTDWNEVEAFAADVAALVVAIEFALTCVRQNPASTFDDRALGLGGTMPDEKLEDGACEVLRTAPVPVPITGNRDG